MEFQSYELDQLLNTIPDMEKLDVPKHGAYLRGTPAVTHQIKGEF